MTRIRLDRDAVEAAVLGGAVLGGGGGGSIEEGRRQGLLAVELGRPEMVDLDDLPPRATLVTVSAVGSPAARTALPLPMHYPRAVELLRSHAGLAVDGLIANECGGLATVNGWLQAALLGVPVVDAPCNGRAHPTGLMGSIGLQRLPGYVAVQAAVGGDPSAGRYVEIVARGRLERAAALVLQAAVQVGGMVAVARNPVSAGYVRENAAPGSIRRSIALGRAMLERRDAAATIDAVCAMLGGAVLSSGTVEEVRLDTVDGLDVGFVRVRAGRRQAAELGFWNEYVSLDLTDGDGPPRRAGTFPDLIATLSRATGLPLSSAEVAVGQDVSVLHVPREKLTLGAGMRDPELLRTIEEATGRGIVEYLQAPEFRPAAR